MAEETVEVEDFRGHIHCGGVKLNLDKLIFSLSCIFCDLEMMNIKEFCYHFQEHLEMSKAENEILLKNIEENMQKSVYSVTYEEMKPSLPIDTNTSIRKSFEKTIDYEIELLEDETNEEQIKNITTDYEISEENQFNYEPDVKIEVAAEHREIEQKPNILIEQEQAAQSLVEQTKNESEIEADEEAATTDIGFTFVPNDEPTSDFRCEICNRRHHNRCKISKTSFPSKAQLKMHARRRCSKPVYECADCDQHFGTVLEFTNHRRWSHEQKSLKLCNTCGKSFQNENLLTEHIKVHTTDRPFVCLECNMTFSKSSALMLHSKLHTEVRKFSCNICRMSFAQNSGLLNHVRDRHGSTMAKEDIT